MTASFVKQVILIQAFWRRCRAAEEWTKLKGVLRKSVYFCDEEVFETLSQQAPEVAGNFFYEYSTGTVYDGEWWGGFRHGQGECRWIDGSKYVGNWSYNYPFGPGTFIYKDGETYTGLWVNPYASLKNRSFLEDIVQGKRDGYRNPSLVWLNCKTQTSYKKLSHKKCLNKIQKIFNSTQEKLLQGKSSLTRPETLPDSGYSGSWKDEKREGSGVNVWENGDIYIGNWENDMQNGWGLNEWIDGSRYVGQYTNNLKEGIGEYIWEDGTKYLGEWKNNVIHGVGKYSWHDGKEYLGQWNQGLMSGFGIHRLTDGRRYEGSWKLGKKHGTGLSFGIDGSFVKNSWVEGKIKR